MNTYVYDNVLEYGVSTQAQEWLYEQVDMVNVIPGEKSVSWLYTRGPYSVYGSYVKFL